jgi:apolipoprotein N-acyltransferase
MLWAAPIEVVLIMLSYGLLFTFIAWLSHKIPSLIGLSGTQSTDIFPLLIKMLGLLSLSYIHPFSFDWFKPELMFVESYLGIEKLSFFVILLGIVLSLWRKSILYMAIISLAYQPLISNVPTVTSDIALITTHTSVKDKWDEHKHQAQFDAILHTIDNAIKQKKDLIILPESVFPIFLNREEILFHTLKEKAKHISIVTGALYWDGETPRNSTYIFSKKSVTIANKVMLVPFGESNPLPDFLSDWVNDVFYDGAVDYKADSEVTDYKIDGVSYRNAICFEATSEKLYEGKPKNMIVLSNNGWFTPSIEPSLQKLLLQYYSKKYGTTIYHSINMSKSYIIHMGKVHTE